MCAVLEDPRRAVGGVRPGRAQTRWTHLVRQDASRSRGREGLEAHVLGTAREPKGPTRSGPVLWASRPAWRGRWALSGPFPALLLSRHHRAPGTFLALGPCCRASRAGAGSSSCSTAQQDSNMVPLSRRECQPTSGGGLV